MTTKKNIVIVQKNLRDTTSGTARMVLLQARHFHSLGHRVFVIAEIINRHAVRQNGAIPLKTARLPLARSGLRRKFFGLQAQRLIQKHGANLVIGHGDILQQEVLYIHSCIHLAHERLHGIPISATDPLARLHHQVLTSGSFSLLICNSNMMKNDLHNRFKVPLEKIHVIYPGLDPDHFNTDNSKELRSVMRAELNIQDDEILIGLITSGNFQLRNVDLLLEAVSTLKSQTSVPFKILIAGKNKDPRFQSKAVQLNIANIVTFAPSILEVEKYYHATDIFVLPAHCEAFGLSVTEAMACAKPVVISAFVGGHEILEGESREYVLHDLNKDELVQRLRTLVEDSGLRSRLGSLNSNTVKMVSSENHFARLVEILTENGFL